MESLFIHDDTISYISMVKVFLCNKSWRKITVCKIVIPNARISSYLLVFISISLNKNSTELLLYT